MNIYKFGGASVKDVAGVRNMLSIVNKNREQLIVVVSAMGKTTNAMELIMDAYFNNDRQSCMAKLAEVKDYHCTIVHELFGNANGSSRLNEQLAKLKEQLICEPSMHYDYEYDRIVSFGELMSTAIIADFFAKEQLNCKWMDIRMLLKTDSLYRDANVEWDLTQQLMQKNFTFTDVDIYLTQGFLGGTLNNMTTTLGREGSDYTAAIIGYAMGAQNVTIWKDVPGVLNADPRRYVNAQKIGELSYMEAIELTYYGAQVIHPKTLKPLQNKGIPLYVKSFVEPELPGTVIQSSKNSNSLLPVFIHKDNQVFVTVSPRDYSFIMDDRLIDVISLFRQYRIKMNLMQNSALNFSACFDKNRSTEKLFEQLNNDFFVRYNDDVELITIRNYTPETIEDVAKGRIVIDSQITRKVARFVLK
ncbi:MAG: aspartate kinase [Cytophagaceae bacterium]|jgi:aspartate kinase|nr:aspartate kinase [Cytophagaceae bacterium]